MDTIQKQYFLGILKEIIDAQVGGISLKMSQKMIDELVILGFYDPVSEKVSQAGEDFVEKETFRCLLSQYDRASLSEMLVTLERYPGFKMTFPEKLEWDFGDAGLWSLETDQLTEKGKRFVELASR